MEAKESELLSRLVPFCPISRDHQQRPLMDYWDSDEERMDSLPISKFRPELIENDVESRNTNANDPLR